MTSFRPRDVAKGGNAAKCLVGTATKDQRMHVTLLVRNKGPRKGPNARRVNKCTHMMDLPPHAQRNKCPCWANRDDETRSRSHTIINVIFQGPRGWPFRENPIVCTHGTLSWMFRFPVHVIETSLTPWMDCR
jgi:hypothetical protein